MKVLVMLIHEWLPYWPTIFLLTIIVLAHVKLIRLPRSFWGLVVQLFYRHIHFQDEIPNDDMATLVVANHHNAFIDPFLIEAALNRPIVRTIRSDWLDHWLIKWLIHLIGAVPLTPRTAQNNSTNGNHTSLKHLNNALASGKAVIIFPEGISHNRSKLKTFKKGAAHLASQFVEATGQPIRVIQVAVYYTDKSKLNSDVWVSIANTSCYNPENPLTDITEESRMWQQAIQSSLPGPLNTIEKQHLNWFADSVTALAPLSKVNFNEHSKVRFNSQTTQFKNWLKTKGLDLSIIAKYSNTVPMAFRMLCESIVAFAGLLPATIGLIVNLPVATLHYWLTRKNSPNEDKWASNAYVIGIPLYPIYWCTLCFTLTPFIAVIAVLSGAYALFYWRSWSNRVTILITTFYCLIQPSIRELVLAMSNQSLNYLPLPNTQKKDKLS